MLETSGRSVDLPFSRIASIFRDVPEKFGISRAIFEVHFVGEQASMTLASVLA